MKDAELRNSDGVYGRQIILEKIDGMKNFFEEEVSINVEKFEVAEKITIKGNITFLEKVIKIDKEIESSADKKDKEIYWVDLNKKIKVVDLRKIGFSLTEKQLKVYLNVGLNLSVLQFDFRGFNAGVAKDEEGDSRPTWGLEGMAITGVEGDTGLSGSLVRKATEGKPTVYNGSITLKASDLLTISALASFGKIKLADGDEANSIFLFAALNYSIGGPPAFFVKGLALGGGYNRQIKLPDVKKVPDFPFVQAVVDPNSQFSKDKDGNLKDASKVAGELSDWLYPAYDQYFVVAGLKFSSFELVESFAMLMAEFGATMRFSLLGQSALALPKGEEKKEKQLVNVTIALRASYDVSQGYFEILAALTDGSFLLQKNCKLSGGVGVCAWLAGPRAGDFLVSLGGCYHPLFKNKKKDYPSLDKLGVNWKINNNLGLKGEVYFAITPACMMFGLAINLNYKYDSIKAWLDVAADFYLEWAPLYYNALVHVGVGASYRLKVWFIEKTFSVEVGADVSVKGPPFSGTAKIDLKVFSISLSFGSSNPPVSKLEWKEFYDQFIDKEEKKKTKEMALSTGSGKAKLTALNLDRGILNQDEISAAKLAKNPPVDPPVEPVVSGDIFTFSVESKIPITKIDNKMDERIGILPLGKTSLKSMLNVQVLDKQNTDNDVTNAFEFTAKNKNIGAALWSKTKPKADDSLIRDVAMGGIYTIKAPELIESNPYKLAPTPKELSFPYSQVTENVDTRGGETISSIKLSDVLKQDFEELYKKTTWQGIQDEPMNYFLDNPVVCSVGCYLEKEFA